MATILMFPLCSTLTSWAATALALTSISIKCAPATLDFATQHTLSSLKKKPTVVIVAVMFGAGDGGRCGDSDSNASVMIVAVMLVR